MRDIPFGDKNPYQFVPSFDELFNKTRDFILEHQGEKGYIDTSENSADWIYGIGYDSELALEVEQTVYGVRVKDNDIEVLMLPLKDNDGYNYYCENPAFEDNNCWDSVRWSEVYFVPTLIAIAENIWEYV